MVEVLGATDRQGALDGAVLEIGGAEAGPGMGAPEDLLVPTIGGTDVLETAPVTEVGEEVGDGLVRNIASEHVESSRLAVVEGDVPVLDPNGLTTVDGRVVLADVPRGIDTGHGGLKARAAPDAAALPYLESRFGGQ